MYGVSASMIRRILDVNAIESSKINIQTSIKNIVAITEEVVGNYKMAAEGNTLMEIEEWIIKTIDSCTTLSQIVRSRRLIDLYYKKLSNERFVNHAPEQVLKKEQQKQSDVISKIKGLEEQLKRLL